MTRGVAATRLGQRFGGVGMREASRYGGIGPARPSEVVGGAWIARPCRELAIAHSLFPLEGTE